MQNQASDHESGLHYNYHRYYDPATGRYLTPDPIGFEGQDFNLYLYTANNPINFVDPEGLKIDWRQFFKYSSTISGPYIARFVLKGDKILNKAAEKALETTLKKLGLPVPTLRVLLGTTGSGVVGATGYILLSPNPIAQEPYIDEHGTWRTPDGTPIPMAGVTPCN